MRSNYPPVLTELSSSRVMVVSTCTNCLGRDPVPPLRKGSEKLSLPPTVDVPWPLLRALRLASITFVYLNEGSKEFTSWQRDHILPRMKALWCVNSWRTSERVALTELRAANYPCNARKGRAPPQRLPWLRRQSRQCEWWALLSHSQSFSKANCDE